MERYLRWEDIINFQGNDLSLKSTDTGEGHVIIDRFRNFHISKQQGDGSKWRLVPIENEFMIISPDYGHKICHFEKDEGKVNTVPFTEKVEGCMWKLGKRGEIYQNNPGGGEKYLWSAKDSLYVTNDGFLADKWLSPIHSTSPEQPKTDYTIFFVVIFLIFILFLMK